MIMSFTRGLSLKCKNLLIVLLASSSSLYTSIATGSQEVCEFFSDFTIPGIDNESLIKNAHICLAKIEKSISGRLTEYVEYNSSNDKKNSRTKFFQSNNIALGGISILYGAENGTDKIEFFPLSYTASSRDEKVTKKQHVYESSLSLELSSNEEVKSICQVENELSGISIVVKHINDHWKKDSGNLIHGSDEIKEKWKDFTDKQIKIESSFGQLQTQIIETGAMISQLSSTIISDSFSYASLREKEFYKHLDETRKKIFDPTISYSGQLESFQKKITLKSSGIERYEKNYRQAINSFYYTFWHSEQRFTHFLLDDSSSGYWEEIIEFFNEKDSNSAFRIKGVFLNIHSRLNLCSTCRLLLKSLVSDNGPLRSKIEQAFFGRYDKELLAIKVFASFRLNYKEGADGWMSYNIANQAYKIDLQKMKDTKNLYLTRIKLGEKDEEISDWQYELDLKQV